MENIFLYFNFYIFLLRADSFSRALSITHSAHSKCCERYTTRKYPYPSDYLSICPLPAGRCQAWLSAQRVKSPVVDFYARYDEHLAARTVHSYSRVLRHVDIHPEDTRFTFRARMRL